MLCLQSLRGFWAGAEGEAVQPRVLLRPFNSRRNRALLIRPGVSARNCARGLQQSVAGLPTGALAEEILTPGEG